MKAVDMDPNVTTLFISDTHAPAHHPDALAFLKAVKKKWRPKHIVSVGDLVDHHTGSFHDIEHGTLSAADEHEAACKFVKELEKVFPKMVITLGNHDKIPARKAKAAGIPLEHMSGYADVYDTPNWQWVDRYYFPIEDGYQNCLVVHNMSTSTLNNAKCHSHCSVQGHFHGVFGIEYFADTQHLRWSMTVGCLIDPDNPAFMYAAGMTNKRPILGVGLLLNGRTPMNIPMILDVNGRWIGKL